MTNRWCCIVTNLKYVEEALGALTDVELRALKIASSEARQVAPGLLAWFEGACDGEFNRRAGFDYRLQPPEAAIDPSQDEVSVEAAYAMRASFAGSDLGAGALTFFDALLELLTGNDRPKQ